MAPTMDPFAPIKLAHGMIAYAGTARSDERGSVHVFSLRIGNIKTLYGSFDQEFSSYNRFHICIYDFGFSNEKMVEETDRRYMRYFTDDERIKIIQTITEFFEGEGKSKRLYIFDLKNSKFDGDVEFAHGWINVK